MNGRSPAYDKTFDPVYLLLGLVVYQLFRLVLDTAQSYVYNL